VLLSLAASAAGSSTSKTSIENLPLIFEPNTGQTAAGVDFVSRSRGYTLLLKSSEAAFHVRGRKGRQSALRMHLIGANQAAAAEGINSLVGKSNYFIGSDPRSWRTNVPQYGRVQYTGIYPGIDLVYYGSHGQLEYDFIVHPGATPATIELAFQGVRSVCVDKGGDLVLRTQSGESRHRRPLIYQSIDGLRREVVGGYRVGRDGHVRFDVTGGYRRDVPLVIDPVLVYSTYLGGTGIDSAAAIAVDPTGNTYILGTTTSLDFPATAGSLSTTHAASDSILPVETNTDLFVTKLNAAGNAVLYSTYIGGPSIDAARYIGVDAAGSAYGVATSLRGFPTTTGAPSTVSSGVMAFRLNPTGSELMFSTSIPGIEVPPSSIVSFGLLSPIVAGLSGSTLFVGGQADMSFTATPGAHRVTAQGGKDIALVRLSADGSARIFATFVGGSGDEVAASLRADAAGNVYIVGSSTSSNLPVTPGAFRTTSSDFLFGFAAKLDATGSTLVYSTMLPAGTRPFGGALVPTGEVLIAGYADNSFVATAGALNQGDNTNGFLLKLNTAGSGLVYAAKIGSYSFHSGCAEACAMQMAADPAGAAYLAGSFVPATSNAFQPFGSANVAVKVASNGASLRYATHFGSDLASTTALVTDSSGDLYIAGHTAAGHIPAISGAYRQFSNFGSTDAFIAKISDTNTTCTFALSSLAVAVGSAEGAATVKVTAPAECVWAVSADRSQAFPWISISGNSTGLGNGSASVEVSANPGITPRSGSFKVAGQTVTISQAGAACKYKVNSVIAAATAPGTYVSVEAPAGCYWSPKTAAPWITVPESPLQGTGFLLLALTANMGPTRTGSVTVGGQVLTVTQLGSACSFDVKSVPSSVPSSGGSGSINVSTGAPDCPWIASSADLWAQVYPLAASTSTVVSYTFFPNYSTTSRRTTLRLAGRDFSVSQEGASGSANQRFVGQMYFNFFGRLPSSSEVAFHVGTLSSIARADLIMNFMNSAEFNTGGRFIAGLYAGLLNRNAEYSGWLFQRNAIATGVVKPNQLVQNFIDSVEWRLKFGAPDNPEFVRLLYRYILLREPSSGEVSLQTGALLSGITRVQLATNFLNSNEFRQGTGPRLTAFLVYALLLQRDPTEFEMALRVAQIGGSAPVKSIVDEIIASDQFSYLH
jgi:hypothetical protein